MKITSSLLSIIVVPFLVLTACQTAPKTTCGPEVRAAFDIGSGSTKMKVGEYDTCTDKLNKVILEDQAKVNYQESLQASSDQTFSEEVQDAGMAALRSLLEKALNEKATRFAGVATAAFRKAQNAPEFLSEIDKKLGIHVKVITQEQEAMIGFKGAASLSQLPQDKMILWDIGGGSQQMVVLNDKKEPVIYSGTLASVSFKNYVISRIQKKDTNKVTTPNPLGKKTTAAASKYAEQHARETVPAEIQLHIKKKDAAVVGIGGVLSRSIVDQVTNKTSVTATEVEQALKKRMDLTDAEIGGEFVQTEITNLVLVGGFMKALNMNKYQPVKASLIDGLWYEKDFWR
ncbi:Ppx/GppA phosphatase family protein [Bdellovibrio sp. HCB2-146]|uniref:Ppx/GppA phosphatase family protein n=1 Tax=Bdellovibrio sp. HCB2-146 TaxID=3394362 RepID=UPI0039BCD634